MPQTHFNESFPMHVQFDGPVIAKSGSNDKGAWSLRQQQAYLFEQGKPYPTPFLARVPDDLPAGYDTGKDYIFAPGSFVADERGNLSLSRYGLAFIAKPSLSAKAVA